MTISAEHVAAEPELRAYPVTEVQARQGWHLARQAAKRQNRNLLQCAAGLATVLGIGGGTGGMVQLSESLRLRAAEVATGNVGGVQEPLSLSPVAITIFTIMGVAAALLLALLILAFRRRQLAERRADEYAVKLIALNPAWSSDEGE